MRPKLSYLSRALFISCSAFALLAIGVRPSAAVSWSNPHHAYVVLVDPTTHAAYVQELSTDPSPGPRLTLGGSNTGFCVINALAIGPQGNLYVSGYFGSTCTSDSGGIEIFAPGASGNVAPIAMIAGPKTTMPDPDGMAFDSPGNLYVAQGSLNGRHSNSIFEFAAGAFGNVAPISIVQGSKTHFKGQNVIHVAVDNAGEIFAGATSNWVGKFPAGASGNVAPLATTTLKGNDFNELQVSGGTVYAAIGFVKSEAPTVYKLSASNLAQTGAITDHRFAIIHADVDASGNVYVEDINRAQAPGLRARLFEYQRNRQRPTRVRTDGTTYPQAGYIVVGP